MVIVLWEGDLFISGVTGKNFGFGSGHADDRQGRGITAGDIHGQAAIPGLGLRVTDQFVGQGFSNLLVGVRFSFGTDLHGIGIGIGVDLGDRSIL